jgi:hypothetical protein
MDYISDSHELVQRNLCIFATIGLRNRAVYRLKSAYLAYILRNK